MSCLYICLFFFFSVLTSASPSEICARKHANQLAQILYVPCVRIPAEMGSRYSFLLFYSCVEEGLRGNVLGHLRSLRCWPVNSVRQIYFVRHPTKSSENTHAEWAEYCTSNVLSLSVKPSGNLHPTSLLPLHKNKSVHICIIFLQNYRKHNLDSYGLFLLLFF